VTAQVFSAHDGIGVQEAQKALLRLLAIDPGSSSSSSSSSQ
jgi:hypothetical protein